MCMAILLLGFACPFPLGSKSGQATKNVNTTPAYLMLIENVFSIIVNYFSLRSQQLNRVN